MRLPLLWACASALGLAVSSAPAMAQTRLVEVNPDRSIEVTGEAAIEASPDFARVTLGVTTTAKDAGEAMAENAKAAATLIGGLKDEGVAAADIQTSNLSISPNFASHQSNTSEAPAITGYTVGNSVTVTVRDLSRLGALIDKAVGGGANAMYGVEFGQSAPSALLDKARPIALADARRKAEIYAAAAGAKLGRLMALSEEVGGPPAPMQRRIFAAASAVASIPIEAGQNKLTVTVTARYDLTQ
jgi:uncharacterized protein YggE